MRGSKRERRSGDVPGKAGQSNGGRRGLRRWSLGFAGAALLLGLVAVSTIITAQTNARASRARHHPYPSATPTSLQPPADLYVSANKDGTVLLSWRPPQSPPVGYRIYRASDRFGPYDIIGTVNAPDIDTFTDDGDLTPGVTYAYTVTSFDRQGESRPVGPIVAVVLAAPTPSPSIRPPQALPTFQPPAPATLTALARDGQGGAPPVLTLPAATGVVPTVESISPTPAVNAPTPLPSIVSPSATPTALATSGANILTPLPTLRSPGTIPTVLATPAVIRLTPVPTAHLPSPVATATLYP